MQAAFEQIDSSKASAGSDADRDKIAEAIEAGVGLKALDGLICLRRRDWGLGAQQAAAAEAKAAAGGALATEEALSAARAAAIQLKNQGKLD